MWFQSEIFSQGLNKTRFNKPGWFIGVSGGVNQTDIINEGAFSIAGLQNSKMNSLSFSGEIGYFFTSHFGLSMGIDYAAYKTKLNLNSYENKFDAIDSENEHYERRVTGTNIKEMQDISYISVPVNFIFRMPLKNNCGFFLQAGGNISFPINKTYSSSGTFTYKGYYSAYNVLLENLPDFGFPNNHNTSASGDLKLQQYNINAIATAGIDVFIKKQFQLVFAASYSKSLTKISAYEPPDKFQLSSDVDQMNSIMGGCSNISLKSLGASVGLRYYFKKHK